MKRALVVDDSQAMRQIITSTIRTTGIEEVDEADCVEAAIQLFEPNKYNIIFTDWHMEGGLGLELIQAVRKQDREIPIILVTVNTLRADVVQAIKAGVSDYLGKPFTDEALREKIEKYVG